MAIGEREAWYGVLLPRNVLFYISKTRALRGT